MCVGGLVPIMLKHNEGSLVAESTHENDASLKASTTPSPDTTATFTSQFVAQLQAMEAVDVTPDEQAAIAALPSGSALLIVRRGPNMGARFLLDADVTTAGRHPNSDIFLDDVTVSRRHAEFRRHGSEFEVRDLASLNGTYLESERIERAPLSDADEVQVGKYRFTFFASRVDLARNSSL